MSNLVVSVGPGPPGPIGPAGPPGPPGPAGPIVPLQTIYNNSIGIPVDIQLSAALGGIRILDVVGLTTPAYEIDSSLAPQDSLRVTRNPAGATAGFAIALVMGASTLSQAIDISQAGSGDAISVGVAGAGNGISIDKSPAVPTAGAGLFVTMGANATGRGVNITQAGTGASLNIVHTGGGAVISITHSVGAGNTILINKSPAVATGGTGINVLYGANTTGTMVNLSQAGSGIAFNLQSTGVGTTLNVGATGVSASAAMIFSASNSPTLDRKSVV